MKKMKYGYNFTEEEREEEKEEEEERYGINSSMKNIPKPETEDSIFIQFLLNRIIKNSK